MTHQASGGAAGGGIIIIRTYSLSGTATLTANGASAYNGTANDAGGGGGAGGSIVVLSANGGEGGLTLQANGGTGGNAWASVSLTHSRNRHGPGGGGGGGVAARFRRARQRQRRGGANGITENPGVAYGATAGAAGTSVTNVTISQTSGTQSGAQCTPDVTLSKNQRRELTRGLTASYTIPVSNISPYGSTSGVVTVNDTLPVGLTPTSASGTGWTCSIAAQTVSCVDSTVLAAGGTYSPIAINATVLQTAPSTDTNIATVSGGGEINLSNDTATNVASVVSSADLSVTNAAVAKSRAAGGNITYTQMVTNAVLARPTTPLWWKRFRQTPHSFPSSAPAGWTCSSPAVGGTGNVVCTSLSMAGKHRGHLLDGRKGKCGHRKRHGDHGYRHGEFVYQ